MSTLPGASFSKNFTVPLLPNPNYQSKHIVMADPKETVEGTEKKTGTNKPPVKKSARQKNAESKGSLKKTIGDPLTDGEAKDPAGEEMKTLVQLQQEKLEDCPFPMPDFSIVIPGWNRVSNTTITQIPDAKDKRGFRDKVLAEQKKNSFKYLVRFPRFAARQRNLWTVVLMSEEQREDLLEHRSRYAYDLDKADMKKRIDYMVNELGIDRDLL